VTENRIQSSQLVGLLPQYSVQQALKPRPGGQQRDQATISQQARELLALDQGGEIETLDARTEQTVEQQNYLSTQQLSSTVAQPGRVFEGQFQQLSLSKPFNSGPEEGGVEPRFSDMSVSAPSLSPYNDQPGTPPAGSLIDVMA
jgi:hypothetical protein